MYNIFRVSNIMDFYSKKLKLIILLTIVVIVGTLSVSFSTPVEGEQLVVWNVGQGQMVTYLTPQECIHFDMGGEKFPKKKLFKLCNKRQNVIYYTHWDRDHINFSLRAKKIFPTICKAQTSLKPPRKKHKIKMIQKIPLCHKKYDSRVRELKNVYHYAQTSNERSRIFLIQNKILIPGDSTKKMEKYWSHLLPKDIQILIAGHHGSKTSSSDFLISKLPELKIAISSSRKKRYGHPHSETIRKFNKKGILFISTEDFHHIRIPLNQKPVRVHSL